METQRVAIGIIQNEAGQLLLTKRAQNAHLPGYWEFPGGKIRESESFKMALRRELAEEVGIQVCTTEKLIEFYYHYPDRCLQFQIFKIRSYCGEVIGNEAQEIRWVDLRQIETMNLPPANNVIVDALQLPSKYMIADHSVSNNKIFSDIEKNLKAGVKLIQFRAHHLKKPEYISAAKKIRELCEQYDARMISNCELNWIEEVFPHAVHLTSSRLREVLSKKERNPKVNYFSASCHSLREVDLANNLGVRCILIGPVHQTKSHPNVNGLEWERFNKLCSRANKPVYALGGVTEGELLLAVAHGAQGIAGIRTFL